MCVVGWGPLHDTDYVTSLTQTRARGGRPSRVFTGNMPRASRWTRSALRLLLAASCQIAVAPAGPYAAHAQRLREGLLEGYDSRVFPSTGGPGAGDGDAPVRVGLQVKFLKLMSLSNTESQLSVKVWWRTWW